MSDEQLLDKAIADGIVTRSGNHFFHDGIRIQGGKAAAIDLVRNMAVTMEAAEAEEAVTPDPEPEATPETEKVEAKAEPKPTPKPAPEAVEAEEAVTVRVVGKIHAPSFGYVHKGAPFQLSRGRDNRVPTSHLPTIGKALEAIGQNPKDAIRIVSG